MDPLGEISQQISSGRGHGRLDAGVLRSLELAETLSAPVLSDLAELGRWHAHRAGEVILTSGVAMATVYIIARGVVQEYLEAATGHLVTTDFLVRGDLIDAGGLQSPLPDLLRARALDDVIVFAFPRSAFEEIAVEHPGVSRLREQGAHDRWSRLALLYLDRTLNRRAGLVAHLLARLNMATGQSTLHLTQVALAQLFTVSRAQLIRDLDLLERRGLIRIERDERGITILDPAGLTRFDDLTGEV